METQEKNKLVNKGYGLAIYLPDEFKSAVKTKLSELSEKSHEKERWQEISKGFEMGLLERTQNRLNELDKVKKTRGRTQDRTR